MNILLIGNGFDLAHGLPTKYKDFLDFIKLFKDYYIKEKKGIIESFIYFNEKVKNGSIDWIDYNKIDKINMFFEKWFNTDNENRSNKKEFTIKIIDEFYNCVKYNIWIEYFLQCNMYQKENWIDFETEISRIIKSIDSDMNESISQRIVLEDKIQCITNEFLNHKYNNWVGKKTYKELRDVMLVDLNKLTRALEIYLCEYVEKIKVEIISPDIKKIVTMGYEEVLQKMVIYCDAISFNYTNTFERVYLCKLGVEYNDYKRRIDYVHGKANINNSVKTNNMVLGIDEYLLGDRKDKEVEFIAFKKYFQRIYKETGNEYKKLLDIVHESYFENILKKMENAKKDTGHIPVDIREKLDYTIMSEKKNQKHGKHYLYIFGHSLDVTDGDILRDLILNDNVYTTIFYLNKDVMGQQIANLVKVIGQDELIKRTGGSTKSIRFKQQQDMITR